MKSDDRFGLNLLGNKNRTTSEVIVLWNFLTIENQSIATALRILSNNALSIMLYHTVCIPHADCISAQTWTGMPVAASIFNAYSVELAHGLPSTACLIQILHNMMVKI